MRTGRALVEFALSTVGQPYMYGVNGQIITQALIDAKTKQYPAQYTPEKIKHLQSQIGKRAYQCNSYLSIYLGKERSANGWRDYGKGGSISSLPDVPGIAVFYPGHTGVYIGNGKVVEARGTFYGVVITDLEKRPWTAWRKYNEINYDQGGDPLILYKGMKDDTLGGTAGNAVSEWQKLLAHKGIKMVNDSGKQYGVDGEYGTATANGTKIYQEQAGLNQTGIVDYPTFAHLLASLREQEQPENCLELENIKNAIRLIKGVVENA